MYKKRFWLKSFTTVILFSRKGWTLLTVSRSTVGVSINPREETIQNNLLTGLMIPAGMLSISSNIWAGGLVMMGKAVTRWSISITSTRIRCQPSGQSTAALRFSGSKDHLFCLCVLPLLAGSPLFRVFFLKILWFFLTLPVLLQRWCSTCPVCVHTLTPRENRERTESGIF